MVKKTLSLILMLSVLILVAACGKTADTSSTSEAEKQAQTSQDSINISTKQLQENISNAEWVVVDTRSNDAFNGWILDGVSRGGHIKGATDFSADWLKVTEKGTDTKLAAVLKDKGITADKKVVLYDANGKDAKQVADYLKKNGINNISLYDVKEWAADSALAMESYKNYEMIVPASWINDVIKNNNSGKAYKIFETSWGEVSEDYNKGHIPGAVHINTDEVEEGPVWNRLPDKRLEKFALNNGITSETTVILYGTDTMPAYRVAAILKYMGVKDVRVLNGGYAKWVSAGYEIETKANAKRTVNSFGVSVPANKAYIIDMPQAKEILADKEGSVLVDNRSWEEHIGETSGYDYIKYKGRPAGAVFGYAGTDPNNLQDFRNIDNTMRNGAEILAMWKEWGITPEKRLSFFCGTGWRAAEVLIYADVMGLKNISLYDGGWNEWSADPKNPVEVGEPKK